MKKYLFKDKKAILINCLISLCGFMCMIGMFYTNSLITDVVVNNDLKRANRVTFLVLGVILALMVCMILSTIITRRILRNAVFSLREDIFINAYSKSIAKYKDNGTNYFSSLLYNDVDIIEDKYFRPLLEIINDSMQIILMSLILCKIGTQYFIIVLALTIPTIIAPFLLKNKMIEQGNHLSKGLEKYTSLIKDTLSMFHTVKYFGKEDSILNRFSKGTECIEKQKYQLASIRAYNVFISSFTVLILKFVSLLYFSNGALKLVIDIATVSLLFSLTNNIGNPIHNILGYIESINSTKGIREKIEELINSKEIIQNELCIVPRNNNILIDDLILELNEKCILNRFSFQFEQGKKYVVLGESGSGKSTFCKVILGYFVDYKGNISVGGIDVKEIEKYQLYKKIVYVSQDTYLFSDTLRNNITLLSDKFSEQQIMSAIKKAELQELIERLNEGLESNIDSESVTLSGGEKQRIALARAFLYDADIYIFDEATAALDIKTTECIERNILGLREKTVISIVHKLNNSIEKYDCVLVVKEGKVVAANSYAKLKDMYPEYGLLLGEGACV